MAIEGMRKLIGAPTYGLPPTEDELLNEAIAKAEALNSSDTFRSPAAIAGPAEAQSGKISLYGNQTFSSGKESSQEVNKDSEKSSSLSKNQQREQEVETETKKKQTVIKGAEITPAGAQSVRGTGQKAKQDFENYLNQAREELQKGRDQIAKNKSLTETEAVEKIDSLVREYTKEQDKDQELSGKEIFARILIGIAPSLIGAAAGSAMGIGYGAGGVAGAQGGITGLKALDDAKEKINKEREKVREATLKAKTETQKNKLKALDDSLAEFDKNMAELPLVQLKAKAAAVEKEPLLELMLQRGITPGATTVNITESGVRQAKDIATSQQRAQESATGRQTTTGSQTESGQKWTEQEQRIGGKGGRDASGAYNPTVSERAILNKLGSQYASRTSAVSEYDAVARLFDDPNASDEQKVVAANGLLKRLNDAAGSDAIQRDEASRLTPFTTFKFLNFTQPGAFVGRDLDEFKKQLAISRAKVAAAANESLATMEQIESGMGTPAITAPESKKQLVLTQDDWNKMSEGQKQQWMGQSASQRQEILKQLRGIK